MKTKEEIIKEMTKKHKTEVKVKKNPHLFRKNLEEK